MKKQIFAIVAAWSGVAACVVALAACITSDSPARVDETNETDRVVAVWVIDMDATVDRAVSLARAAGKALPDAVVVKRLRRDLVTIDTQLGLNGDGTFILRNRAADVVGVLTVEGSWTRAGSTITLSGIRVSGRTVMPPQTTTYRLENERLVQAEAAAGTVCPVLKKGLVPR